MNYEVVIGLEVHAELNTESKIFCGCKNSFGNEVNSNVCPICAGMPGTLPMLNEKVVDYAVKMGLALNCEINNVCKQDRKHYFYPDLPKAYQISQYDIPLCGKGHLDVLLDEGKATKRIGVTRIHIEEDAGKLIHDDAFSGSLVDMNRCGVPLIEIVSEPDMRTTAEAKAYLEGIKAILGALDISDCKMQEGSIRCDINVSVMPEGSKEFGTRVEMKNVNSFSAAVRAIDYESARQIKVLSEGGEIYQETRRWDNLKNENFVLRSKEDAQDYKFFRDPDLKTIVVKEERIEELRAEIPELPMPKLLRIMKDYSLPYSDAVLLVENQDRYELFAASTAIKGSPKATVNWLNGDVVRLLVEKNVSLSETKLTAEKLSEMIDLIDKATISNAAAKNIIEEVMFTDKTAQALIEEKGLGQISDNSALEAIVNEVVSNNAKAIEDYRNGKTNVLGFLVGQCMKASKGKGNPEILKGMIISHIEG